MVKATRRPKRRHLTVQVRLSADDLINLDALVRHLGTPPYQPFYPTKSAAIRLALRYTVTTLGVVPPEPDHDQATPPPTRQPQPTEPQPQSGPARP